MKRLFASAACLSAWLILLFSGISLGGAIHLFLVLALVAFPWKSAARPSVDVDPPD